LFLTLFFISTGGAFWYGVTTNPYEIEILLLLGMALLISLTGAILSMLRVNTHISLEAAHASYSAGEEFVSLYDRSPVAYLTTTADGSIVRFNPAAVKLLTTTINAMNGHNLFDQVLEVKGTDTGVMLGKLRAGMLLNDLEVHLRTYTDTDIWVLLSASAEPHTGERLVSLVDITEAKKVDTAKSEFVALATHQLRTPIAAIRWNTELLANSLKDSASEKQARYLDKISRNVVRMTTLINDFLHVSKLEMGTFAAEVESINLTEYLDGVVEEFAERFQNKHLTLDRHEGVPGLSFSTDRRLFHIIMSNLLSNASKYATDNGTVWLKANVEERMLVLTVADNGIGIPAAEVERLFTKFYRASNAVKQQAEGTGLGLYIVKQAVEQLGGTISVTAEADKGATFIVRLPIRD